MKVVECGAGGAAKGPVDFTGYWALVRHEGMDEFLRAAGFPWVVRKAALKFGGSAVDLVSHVGALMRVTSLNAKGSWSREYDLDREVVQSNAEGTPCKTTSWWEGRVFRSRMEGSQLGCVESWRYLRGTSMAVRTALRPARGGPEAVMWWYFDRMETLQRHVARGGGSLHQQIESDQRRVVRATRKDTSYLRDVLLDWQRWKSPADEFIHVAAPPAGLARHARSRRNFSPGSASPRTLSPVSMSKSPSNDSLSALPPGVEARSEARSALSESRGSRARLADPDASTNALDRMARQAAALAIADDAGTVSPPPGGTPPLPPRPQQQQQQQQRSGRDGVAPATPSSSAAAAASPAPAAAGGERVCEREPTLSYPGGVDVPVEAAAATQAAGPPPDLLTIRPSSGGTPGRPPLDIEAAAGSGSGGGGAADSDAATRGSAHQRTGSLGSVGAARPVHYKSLSADSTGRGGAASTPGRASPRSATPAAQPPLGPAEHLMALRLREFADGRGIAAVVPVATPNDTPEPQLLGMSPEQAEETAAKLRELEADMLLRRQEDRRGCTLCGCLVLTLASDTLPEHLRVWEMTLT